MGKKFQIFSKKSKKNQKVIGVNIWKTIYVTQMSKTNCFIMDGFESPNLPDFASVNVLRFK